MHTPNLSAAASICQSTPRFPTDHSHDDHKDNDDDDDHDDNNFDDQKFAIES